MIRLLPTAIFDKQIVTRVKLSLPSRCLVECVHAPGISLINMHHDKSSPGFAEEKRALLKKIFRTACRWREVSERLSNCGWWNLWRTLSDSPYSRYWTSLMSGHKYSFPLSAYCGQPSKRLGTHQPLFRSCHCLHLLEDL